MAYQVTLTPHAQRDLAEIWRFISSDNLDAADAFRDKLLAQAYSLKRLALRGPRVAGHTSVRKTVFQNYSIYYDFSEATGRVYILRFWHAARNPRRFRLQESAPAYAATIGTHSSR